jgi:hypothetical protein
VRMTIFDSHHCVMTSEQKRGPVRAPESDGTDYLPLRVLLSSVSGGRTTRRPSIGKAFSSMLNPRPSLCGNAAPMRVQGGSSFVFRIAVTTPRSGEEHPEGGPEQDARGEAQGAE